MYHVLLSREAEKGLDKIDYRYFSRMPAALENIAKDPLIGKRLGGEYAECLSVRVWPYRIIYSISKKEKKFMWSGLAIVQAYKNKSMHKKVTYRTPSRFRAQKIFQVAKIKSTRLRRKKK